MTPVAAPADKRFRRSRVSPARKRRWRPSWWTVARVALACAVLGYGGYRAIGYVVASDAFTVTRVTVEGHQRMSRGEVLALLDGLSDSNIVTADLDAWQQKLLDSPWVRDASMRRMLPGTVAVVIAEREPIGIGRLRGSLFLIDRTGAIIDEYGPNYADLDLPVVDGLTPAGDADAVDAAQARLVARLMDELQRWPELAGRVSQVDVTDPANAVVLLEGDTALLRVGAERFSERLRAYVDLVPALRERVPAIDYVDLRFDERVYVKPQAAARASGGRRR